MKADLNRRALLLLNKIPRGKVTSYKALAEACNTSPRAIGRIMANNRCPEIYPCYKVVRSDGSPGGYKGSTKGESIAEKTALLKRDGVAIEKGRISRKHFWRFS